MGFTTYVFIRKNTPELRDKLEEFGYKILSPLFDKGENLIAGYSLYSNYCAFKNSDLNWFIDNVKPIDCNQNEELFLAIAALRDDSDNNQWFTDSLGYWQKCIGSFKFPYHAKLKLHKATIEELIEHFKETETWNIDNVRSGG